MLTVYMIKLRGTDVICYGEFYLLIAVPFQHRESKFRCSGYCKSKLMIIPRIMISYFTFSDAIRMNFDLEVVKIK